MMPLLALAIFIVALFFADAAVQHYRRKQKKEPLQLTALQEPFYAFIDIQTNGLITPNNIPDIVELHWTVTDSNYIPLSSNCFVIAQENLGSAEAKKKHNLSNSIVKKQGISLLAALRKFCNETQAPHWVFYNRDFDCHVLQHALDQCNLTLPHAPQLQCLMVSYAEQCEESGKYVSLASAVKEQLGASALLERPTTPRSTYNAHLTLRLHQALSKTTTIAAMRYNAAHWR